VPQLIQYGEVRRPQIGASLTSVSDLVERGITLPVKNGLLVRSATPGGSAAIAGIRGLTQDRTTGEVSIGDIITGVDGEKINDTDDLYRLLDKKNIGDTVNVEVYRGGRSVNVPVRLMASSNKPGNPGARRVQ
jgi:serine protease Do